MAIVGGNVKKRESWDGVNKFCICILTIEQKETGHNIDAARGPHTSTSR